MGGTVSKNAGLQGSTPSGHRMTTGFGQLLAYNLLYKGNCYFNKPFAIWVSGEWTYYAWKMNRLI